MKTDAKNIRGISGSTLKIIAVISMLIDHIGASLLIQELKYHYTAHLYQIYAVMRHLIGRLAFPIYCFLLVEGFNRTKNRMRYAGRLFLFALISEIPFDLAFSGAMVDSSHQNVFFTLLIGLLMMWGMAEIEKRNILRGFKMVGYLAVILLAAAVAKIFSVDYGARGIAAIALLYLFRKKKVEQIIAGCIAFLWEVTAPLAFLFVAFYNGKRGLKMKYMFYIFYPLHLLILYFISVIIF